MQDVVHARRITSRAVSKNRKGQNQKAFASVKSIVAGLSVLAMFVFTIAPLTAFADQPHYEITGNDPVRTDLTVSWDGTALGNPVAGQVEDHGVCIDWDEDQDATTHNWEDAIFNSTNSTKSFTATWSGSHPYSGSGTYHIFARVHHATCTGAESSDLGTVAEIIVIPPPADQFTVTVAGSGSGDGTVTGTDINCTIAAGVTSGDCEGTYDDGTPVTLTAIQDTGSTFDGWSADCTGNSTCNLTVDANKNVTAAFNLESTLPACSDGIDNDNDELIDFDSDPGCSDANDNNETDTPSNNAPVAVNDSYLTDFNTTLTVTAPGILTNDTDDDSDTLTVVIPIVTDVTNGTLTLNSDGSFTYEPDTDFVGSDSFTYKANDGTDDSNVATVDITVNPEDFVPECSDDIDNDNDGLTDFNSDPGCSDANDNDETDSARFTLNVTISNEEGDGEGSVAGIASDENPIIDCDSLNEENDCSEDFTTSTDVTLTATAHDGSSFEGSWTSGPCSGSNNPICAFTVSSAMTVNAHFSIPSTSGGGGGGSHHSSNRTPGVVLGETTEVPPTPVVQGATLPTTGTSADFMLAIVLMGLVPFFRKNQEEEIKA